MPNHIKNRLQINATPEKIEEIINLFGTFHKAQLYRAYDNSIICKDNSTDNFSVGWFNERNGIFHTREENSQTIGLPENWEFEIKEAFLEFPDFNKIIPSPDCPEYRDEPNQEAVKNSPNWWRNWNIENWGTKWSGYEFAKEKWNVFSFETAWNAVPKIIEKISKQFPEVEFLYDYADEDTGYNCGKIKLLNGIIETFFPEGGTKEAYDIAFELRPHYADWYVLVDGNYQQKEDEE